MATKKNKGTTKNKVPKKNKGTTKNKVITIVLGILAVIVVVAVIGVACWRNGVFADDQQADDGGNTPAAGTEWFSYNAALQSDSDAGNDYNFGHDRYAAAEAEYATSGNGADKDTFIRDWLNEDFKSSIGQDQALCAAVLAYSDSVTGQRKMGEFYDSVKGDWSLAINKARDTFISDSAVWQQKQQLFKDMLSKSTTTVSIKTVDEAIGTITDQMYMDPLTGGAPDVIVKNTTDHAGHVLVYTVRIKDNEFKLMYRAECGYQPCNVAELMNIQPTVTTATGDGGSDTPTPDPTPTKDKTQDPVYQGNAETLGGSNKSTDGTGEYQATRSEQATDTIYVGSDSGSDSGASSSGSSSESTGSGSGTQEDPYIDENQNTTPIEEHSSSWDGGSEQTGDETATPETEDVNPF